VSHAARLERFNGDILNKHMAWEPLLHLAQVSAPLEHDSVARAEARGAASIWSESRTGKLTNEKDHPR
jgi:hypothetical protein